jgi:hypothetical protein
MERVSGKNVEIEEVRESQDGNATGRTIRERDQQSDAREGQWKEAPAASQEAARLHSALVPLVGIYHRNVVLSVDHVGHWHVGRVHTRIHLLAGRHPPELCVGRPIALIALLHLVHLADEVDAVGPQQLKRRKSEEVMKGWWETFCYLKPPRIAPQNQH